MRAGSATEGTFTLKKGGAVEHDEVRRQKRGEETVHHLKIIDAYHHLHGKGKSDKGEIGNFIGTQVGAGS